MSKKFYFLFLIFLAFSSADIHAAPSTPSKKATISESNSDGSVLVKLVEEQNGRRETLLIKSGDTFYPVPDERVKGYNEADDSYNHDLYLSPDAKWVFVTRKLFHTTDIGYLYHLEGKHFMRVRPQGLRFDEAALVFSSRRLHFSYNPIGDGTRIIYFNQWTDDGKRLTFEFHSSRHYESKHYQIIKGFYDLQSRRFGLISHSVEQ